MNVLIAIIIYVFMCYIFIRLVKSINKIKHKSAKPYRSDFDSYDEYFHAYNKWEDKM